MESRGFACFALTLYGTPPQPDAHALLAQLVAAQVRTEAAMAARAEAARTSARLAQIEEGLRSLLETPTGGCGEGEETRAG